ncbi:MAG: FlgO family outer membrane protein [Betaproteobacteria bacterium]|nr:FlgO family outer membrane protein [Betaproteobacteria bacterium]
MRLTFIIVFVTLFAGLMAGCADQPATYTMATLDQFTPDNYNATEQLLKQLKGKLSPTQPLIVATLVNIDHLEQSSTLGRLISEQVSAKFSQAGLQVVEMKLRENIFMKQDQGELMLSRNVKDIAHACDAQAVVVGTYAEGDHLVYINLKVIQPKTDIVLAVYNYALPKNKDVSFMLRSDDDNN